MDPEPQLTPFPESAPANPPTSLVPVTKPPALEFEM